MPSRANVEQQNMRRQNLIQGTTFGYTQWVPVPLEGRLPYTRAPLYGQIFAADVIGHHPVVQVYPLPESTWDMPVRAIYQDGDLAKYVVMNMEEYNSTASYERRSREVTLAVPKDVKSAVVERLTASGADADEGIEWAGLSWNYTDGRLAQQGEYRSDIAKAQRGSIRLDIPASEAVLITIDR